MNQRKNWKGAPDSKASSDWKSDWQKSSGEKQPAATKRRFTGLRAVLAFLAGLVCLAVLLLSLPYSPDRTPLFLLVETDYQTPWDANGWALEDADLLRRLDNTVLDVLTVDSEYQTVDARLEALAALLAKQRSAMQSTGTVLFYFNCQGLVNQSGEACLAFREHSPFQPESWLTLKRLLEAIDREVPESIHKVFIIDGQRTRSDWQIGVALNTFNTAVDELVAETSAKNVWVLTSAAAGERARANSPFAQLVTLGLAGFADGCQSNLLDRRVSLAELQCYVGAELNGWSQHNFGEPQTAAVFSNAKANPELCLSMASDARGNLQTEVARAAPSSLLTTADVDRQWQRFQELPREFLLAIDPVTYSSIEHRLLRLEAMLLAGPSLRERVRAELEAVTQQLDQLGQLDGQSLGLAWQALGAAQPYFLDVLEPHSLAVGRYFGTLGEAEVEQIAAEVARLSAAGLEPTAPTQDSTRLNAFSEIRLPQMLIESGAKPLWDDTGVIQQLQELHALSNQLAVPSAVQAAPGLRAHRILRPSLAAIDQQRRQLEDQLFIGPQGAEQLPRSAPEVVNRFREVAEQLQGLGRTWQTADRLNAELLYYTMWLSDPFWGLERQHSDLELDLLREVVERLVDNAQTINRVLADLRPDATFTSTQYEDRVQSVRNDLDFLRDATQDYASRLAQDPSTERSKVTELALALKLPFLPVQTRSLLREKYLGLLSEGHVSYAEAAAGAAVAAPADVDETPAGSQSFEARVVSAVAQWGPVWGTKLLGWANPALTELSESADERLRIATFQGLLLQHRRRVVQDNALSFNEGTDDALTTFNAAAQRVRSSCPLWFARTDDNLNRELHFVYLQELLRDLANRGLEDCWGAAPGLQEPTFFEQLIKDYLVAAKSIKLPRGISPINVEPLERRAKQRGLFLRSGVSAVAADESLAPGISPLRISETLQINLLGEKPTPGTAAIFARDAQGDRRQMVLINSAGEATSAESPSMEFPPAASSVSLLLGDLQGDAPAGRYDLITYFRGHETKAPFVVLGDSGRRYEWDLLERPDAQLTVQGKNTGTPALIFILDCSESMSQLMPDEYNQLSQSSKLDGAVGSLLRMLSELSANQKSRIGIVLFGHRLSWSTTEPLRVISRPEIEHLIPASVTPSTDVELMLPLGRFDEFSLGQVKAKLEAVVPWGQSPLYLAIQQAIGEFYGKAEKADAAVVVITDGMNYQFTPPGNAADSEPPVSETQILRELKAAGIPVHVLGFSLAESSRAAASQQFAQIAQVTGGTYQPAEGERELLRLLRERVGSATYRVTALPDLQSTASWSAKLNQPVQIIKQQPAVQELRVEFENARALVEVEGGESLLLQYVSSGERFLPLPYNRDFPLAAELVSTSDQRFNDLLFRAHRPRKSADAVEFTVSVQSTSRPFTRRPTECWLEILPCNADGQSVGDPYVYFDPNWQSDEPVPVLAWKATSWPSDAVKARIRFWCKYARTPARTSLSMASIDRIPVDAMEPSPLDGLPNVNVSLRIQDDVPTEGTFELEVIEIHGEDSSGVGSLQVQVSGRQQPVKTTRYFDRRSGIAVHRFRFPSEARRDVIRGSQLEFCTKQDIEANAFQIAGGDGVLIDVVSEDALLPFNAADVPLRFEAETEVDSQP